MHQGSPAAGAISKTAFLIIAVLGSGLPLLSRSKNVALNNVTEFTGESTL